MTISLPPKLQREVAKAARRDQITLSEYVRKAIQAAYPIGKGYGPMHHLFKLDQ